MGIFNYFLIGLIFSLTVDFLLSLKVFKKHPRIKNIKWGWNERLLATFVWPIGILIFLISFIKTSIKK